MIRLRARNSKVWKTALLVVPKKHKEQFFHTFWEVTYSWFCRHKTIDITLC